jgi:hypothetical protein
LNGYEFVIILDGYCDLEILTMGDYTARRTLQQSHQSKLNNLFKKKNQNKNETA